MTAEIEFHAEDVDIPDYIEQATIPNWLEKTASHYGATISSLNYIFCSDEYLLEINQTYLDHNYYTDIITFPFKQGKVVEGDIFISVDRVKENAAEFSAADEKSEMLRVMAHGLLHLIGFTDKDEEAEAKMRSAENKALEIFADFIP
ncbi:MAG: rRNA maturation RNase YbeY [Saprospiraceae bacterium]|nr:rRNA maturation RNase YbeY [Saprospiraceae bacterium]